MYKLINRFEFIAAFKRCERNNHFSYEALNVLYDYYEDIEPHNEGLGIELDVIAFCCEWTQYKSIEEYNEAYETDYKSYEELVEAGWCSVIHVEGDEFLTDEH
tara:strand:+ start:36 stop:344 length:309 start_codon:yes stop_codon:yes gene_type:complete